MIRLEKQIITHLRKDPKGEAESRLPLHLLRALC